MELPRRVVKLGDTRRNLQAFPQPVRRDLGAALFAAKCGETAEHVKPFEGVGSAVMEVAERYATDTLQLGKSSMCCTCFRRNRRSVFATPKKDVDLIVKRYKEARERAKNE